jgi:hypothetical protein
MEESGCEPQVERLVLAYNKTDVLGLQTFLRDKFAVWASKGSCVEEKWNNLKNIVYECIERFVPRKKLTKNSDPEYYNKEIKRLKSKVRKVYNRRKLGASYLRGNETTNQAATCSQEICTRGIFKIDTMQRGQMPV